jgi:hypothetical protein
MPLAFESTSHGRLAFGFFQIESDMLLLDRLFFFADSFCQAVARLAAGQEPVALPGWRIDDPRQIGDLHAAIAGQVLSGLIGATYRRWPFPREPEAFRQNPDGHQTQAEVRDMISRFGQAQDLALRWQRPLGKIWVQEYGFSEHEFARLVTYVDRGGHPRWKDGRRPDYVEDLVAELRRLKSAWAP